MCAGLSRRALLAACLIGLAAFAAAEDAAPTEAQAQMTTNFKAEDAKQVYIPTTTNDYGSMIYSLLEQQLNFIAAKDGADVRALFPLPAMHA